jgi:FkbM family methyltransferase
MALYGLREGNDFDFLTEIEVPEFAEPLIQCHNAHAGWYGKPLARLIYDPRHFLRYDGVKYVSLAVLAQMKLRRGEGKDQRDIATIKQLGLEEAPGVFRELPGMPDRRNRFKRLVRAVLPEDVRRLINRSLEGLQAGSRALRRVPDYLRRNPEIVYRGFCVSHAAGDSLVDRIRGGDLYEPEVTRALLRLLQQHETGALLLDIGANIGLISLNLLSLLPSTRVHAFEPGPRAAELFRRTITMNHLEDSITLHQQALATSKGSASFMLHSSRHSSGDGFLDTGRAGRCRAIEVPTDTLDQWWESAGRPRVDAMKIDTEGAELWVLEGGVNLIKECRPALVLEVNSSNLVNYAHDADAVESLLLNHGYTLQTLAGTRVPVGQLARFAEMANDFLALPPVKA